MSEHEYQSLLESALRRPLNACEEARLRTYFLVHPEAQENWEEQLALHQSLRQLPDAPLSSHFTGRVLAGVGRPERVSVASAIWAAWTAWFREVQWARAAAMAVIVLGVGVLSHRHYDQSSRFELATDLQAVSSVAKLPSVDMLKDFDFINGLGPVTPSADVDLLNALDREPN